MKQLLILTFGLLITPIFWLLQKLRIIPPPPSLPVGFQALSTHLTKNGVFATCEMQQIQISNAKEIASFRIGVDPKEFYVVTVTRSENEDEAKLVEAEALKAPQFTGVCHNGPFVMACTFNPPNAELEKKFQGLFLSYNHGL